MGADNVPVWAMPVRIRIKSTGEVGRLHLIYYDYDSVGNDLLVLQMDDGRQVNVLGIDAEHVEKEDQVQS